MLSQMYATVFRLITWFINEFCIPYQHCASSMKDLPNMGEKERGKPDEAPATSLSVNVSGTITSGSQLTTTTFSIPAPVQAPHPSPKLNGNPPLPNAPATGRNGGVLGTWAAGWRNVIWEKWRWGALIALAVVVSRLSG